MAGNGNPKSIKNLRPYQPGQSGNPAGASRGKRWRTVIAELAEVPAIFDPKSPDKEIFEKLEQKLGRTPTNRDWITFKQMIKAQAGDTAATRLIMDREEGRPAVESNEPGGGDGSYLDFLDQVAGEDE